MNKVKSNKSKVKKATAASGIAIHCSYQKMVAIGQLKPNPENPNSHPQRQVDKLAAIIKAHGWRHPITVSNRSGFIVSGHCRRAAAEKLRSKKCPVDYQDFKSKAEERAVLVADNVIGELAEEDFEKMSDIVAALEKSRYNLDLTALTAEQIEEYLAGQVGPDPADDIVPEPPKKAKTKTGDLYILGNHRLLCGDATKSGDVKRLMGKEKADMVFTDPPYGMCLNADFSGAKSKLKMLAGKGIRSGAKHRNVIGDHGDFKPALITTIFENFGYCKEIFTWGADYYSDYLTDKNNGSWIVWDKRLDEQADKMYGSTFELCWSKARHKRAIARIKWAGVFGIEQEFDHKRHHPTQKPIALAEWVFEYYSLKDKRVVVDLYLGSGCTLIACEKTNRKCFGMEIEPKYCDVIVKRWEDFTGKKAKRVRN